MGVIPISVGVLPHGDVARQQYIDQGGSIPQFGTFGVDQIGLILSSDGMHSLKCKIHHLMLYFPMLLVAMEICYVIAY